MVVVRLIVLAATLSLSGIAAGQAGRLPRILFLRGAKPGDIPIEQPVDFELRVNLRAAKAIGLQVPNW